MPPKVILKKVSKRLEKLKQEVMGEALRAVWSGVIGLSSASNEFSMLGKTRADRFYNSIKEHCGT